MLSVGTLMDSKVSRIWIKSTRPNFCTWSDSIEERISLSDRFGLWLSFHPFTQDQYLAVVEQTLRQRGFEMN